MPEPVEKLQKRPPETAPKAGTSSLVSRIVTAISTGLEQEEPAKKGKTVKKARPRDGEAIGPVTIPESLLERIVSKAVDRALREDKEEHGNLYILWVLGEAKVSDLYSNVKVRDALSALPRKLPEKLGQNDVPALTTTLSRLQALARKVDFPQDIERIQRVISNKIEKLGSAEQIAAASPYMPEQTHEEMQQVISRAAARAEGEGGAVDLPPDIKNLVDQARRARMGRNKDEMENIDKQIRKAMQKFEPPQGLIPGSELYMQALDEIVGQYKALESELDDLAQGLADVIALEMQARLKAKGEQRPLGEFDGDVKRFVDTLRKETDPGRLAGYLFAYPEMIRRLQRVENRRYLHQLFLQIMQPVLQESETPTQESLDLYRRADLVTFLNLVRDIERPYHTERRKSLGRILADKYIRLKNTLIQSHDVDYWAAHTQVEVRQFVQSLALYRNEYFDVVRTNPLVSVAYRAYEEAIIAIRETHGGYINPGLISGPEGEQYWDELAEQIFRKMISQGVVYQAETDEYGLVVEKDGMVKLKDKPINWENRQERLTDLEVSEALKLGKGFGVATMQLIRHFAYSRGPGADHLKFGMKGFHSLPRYEGIAKYMNPMVHLFSKFKMGDWKFWHFFNQLLPEPIDAVTLQKKIDRMYKERHLDETLYRIAREGNWDEVYGKEGCQRIMDLVNLTNTSNFGPWSGLWRILDATIGWNEREREKLGGTINLMLSGGTATGYVREVLAANGGMQLFDKDGDLVLAGYRLEFARGLAKKGKMGIKRKNGYYVPENDNYRKEFEKQWIPRGEGIFPQHGAFEKEIMRRWNSLSEKKKKQYTSALTAAYKLKTAIQMAERNPLFVARHVKIKNHRLGGPPEISLRDLIIEEILKDEDGKPLEIDLDITTTRTPGEQQMRYMKNVVELESDVMAVREYLMRADEGRGKGYSDFSEDEFDELVRSLIYEREERDDPRSQAKRNETRQNNVIKYFNLTHQALLGKKDGNQWLKDIGLEWKKDLEGKPTILHHDFDKILNLIKLENGTVKDGETLLKAIDEAKMSISFENADRGSLEVPLISKIPNMDLRWSIDFTDVVWDLDWINLGATQTARAAGDLASHAGAIDLMGQYIQKLTWQFGDKQMDELVDLLDQIQKTTTGDDVSWGWHNAGLWAYLTMRIYKQYDIYAYSGIFGKFFDSFLPSSYMQKLVDRWGAYGSEPNELYKFIHKLGIKGVLPPKRSPLMPDPEVWFNMTGPWTSIGEIEQAIGATRDARILVILMNILTVAPILAMITASFQSVTKEEEEK